MNFHQKLVVLLYIGLLSNILFIQDLNSVLREFILWDQRFYKGFFCENSEGLTKVLLNYISSVLNFVLIFC